MYSVVYVWYICCDVVYIYKQFWWCDCCCFVEKVSFGDCMILFQKLELQEMFIFSGQNRSINIILILILCM